VPGCGEENGVEEEELGGPGEREEGLAADDGPGPGSNTIDASARLSDAPQGLPSPCITPHPHCRALVSRMRPLFKDNGLDCK